MLPSRTGPIAASTRLCAVYGHPVRHSASPAMQNAGIAALGLDWRYLACSVRPNELREALLGARAMRFVGVNLTIPHKLLALDMMDDLDESARRWGAVNTVRFEAPALGGGWSPLAETEPDQTEQIRLRGFNTDADAIVRGLREDLDLELRGAAVLLLGAGGAGRVAALRLIAEGVTGLWLVNRTEAKAHAVAADIARMFPETSAQVVVGYPRERVDLVLNATSVGLRAEDPLPIDLARFDLRHARAVYDMIYRPAETSLLAAARSAGCRAANGLGMLLYQGTAALEIWSGRPAPVDVMRRALNEHVYGRIESR